MNELEQHLVSIRQCREADLDTLNKVAAADGHAVIAPTYVVNKGEQMVGYLGIVPAVLVWLDTERVKARDSVVVLNTFENILSSQACGVMALPCTAKSPLRPFLPRLGYVDSGETKLFLKNLKA